MTSSKNTESKGTKLMQLAKILFREYLRVNFDQTYLAASIISDIDDWLDAFNLSASDFDWNGVNEDDTIGAVQTMDQNIHIIGYEANRGFWSISILEDDEDHEGLDNSEREPLEPERRRKKKNEQNKGSSDYIMSPEAANQLRCVAAEFINRLWMAGASTQLGLLEAQAKASLEKPFEEE